MFYFRQKNNLRNFQMTVKEIFIIIVYLGLNQASIFGIYNLVNILFYQLMHIKVAQMILFLLFIFQVYYQVYSANMF